MSGKLVRLGMSCFLLFTVSSEAATMKAHFIDVGQGASTLLEFSCGTVLIDLGGETNSAEQFSSNQKLRAYLERFFDDRPERPRRIDLLVISHPHIDHTRGKAELLTSDDPAEVPYVIANYIDNTLNKGSGKAQQKALRKWARDHGEYEGIKVKNILGTDGLTSPIIDPISCADVDPTIRVLWGRVTPKPSGWTSEDYGNENNHSIVLRIDFGGASFLFPGDIEEKAELALTARYQGTSMLDVDVYQAAHHGSLTSSIDPLLQAVTPEIVVIPVGDPARPGPFTANKHGHPRKLVVGRLVTSTNGTRPAATVPVARGQEDFEDTTLSKAIYAVGWDGNVIVVADSDGTLEVQTD